MQVGCLDWENATKMSNYWSVWPAGKEKEGLLFNSGVYWWSNLPAADMFGYRLRQSELLLYHTTQLRGCMKQRSVLHIVLICWETNQCCSVRVQVSNWFQLLRIFHTISHDVSILMNLLHPSACHWWILPKISRRVRSGTVGPMSLPQDPRKLQPFLSSQTQEAAPQHGCGLTWKWGKAWNTHHLGFLSLNRSSSVSDNYSIKVENLKAPEKLIWMVDAFAVSLTSPFTAASQPDNITVVDWVDSRLAAAVSVICTSTSLP